ncbi:MAG: cation transporter [Planctomycetaceae bacterium]|nr:cation transporter [Planctomycetaceae bacterium]
MFRRFAPHAAFTAVMLVTAFAVAASPNTKIVCSEMCGGCAKKITAKLQTLPDIASIQCDRQTKTVTIVPKQGKQISPLTLWSTMESIGKTPVSLSGPGGTFNTRPAQ